MEDISCEAGPGCCEQEFISREQGPVDCEGEDFAGEIGYVAGEMRVVDGGGVPGSNLSAPGSCAPGRISFSQLMSMSPRPRSTKIVVAAKRGHPLATAVLAPSRSERSRTP